MTTSMTAVRQLGIPMKTLYQASEPPFISALSKAPEHPGNGSNRRRYNPSPRDTCFSGSLESWGSWSDRDHRAGLSMSLSDLQ